MATSALIILDKRRSTPKGYPIKIRITNKGSKYVSLNEYSELEHWNETNVNKSHPNYRKLFFKLNKRALQLTEEIDYCNDNNLDLNQSIDVIKKGLNNKDTEIFLLNQRISQLQEASGITFIEFCETRIKEKESINESTSHYKSVKDIIRNYDSEITLNGITYEWINDFINFKLSGPTQRGGVNSYLRTMAAVYHEAQRRSSLGIKKEDPFKGVIKKTGRKKDIVKLNRTDFVKLINFGPEKVNKQTKEVQTRNVSIWLFQFYIGGHDFIDISLLKWKNIKKDRAVFRRYKLRNKPEGGLLVDNKIFPFAMDVINRYGTKDQERVFGTIPDPIKDREKYDYYIRSYNRSLKSISEKLKLSDIISSKSTRYLFRSKAGELLLSDIAVAQIQAHKLTGMTYNYQNRMPYKVIDKCHKKILKKTFKLEEKDFINNKSVLKSK